MEEISVWIPTYKRPEMLRTALRSVASQTAVKAIREVVVTENGLDERSRDTCAEFSELPINYIIRQKSLSPGTQENTEAYKQTLRDFKTRLVALLFDDDWWMPDHLARSLEGHAQATGSVASFCSCIYTTGESGYFAGLLGDFVPWFAAGGRRTYGRWVLSLADLVVASQISTPFHYSSMVIDRNIYLSCVEAIGYKNPYDTDRLLAVELGLRGKMVFDPVPGVLVRVHPFAESARLEQSGEALRWSRNSTDVILGQAKAQGLNLREEFAARLQSTQVPFERIRELSHMQNVDYLIQKGVLDKELHQGSKHWPYVKRILKEFTPPFIYGKMAKILRFAV